MSESGQTASDVNVTFKGSGDQTTDVAATIVGVDETTDVALLKVDPSQSPTLTPVKLGDSSKVAVGESVVAIGNPLGLDFSLSTGVVSAVDREIQSPNGATITGAIQTDASINPGNSGGPLFDASGAVIGINEQIASQSGGNEGIGFAVPIDTAVKVMEQMKSGSFQPSQSQASRVRSTRARATARSTPARGSTRARSTPARSGRAAWSGGAGSSTLRPRVPVCPARPAGHRARGAEVLFRAPRPSSSGHRTSADHSLPARPARTGDSPPAT